jgi:sigma-E factor negative regulatory protein RseC
MSMLCHEEGMVSGVLPGNRVKVTVQRSEACHSCSAKGACQTLGGQTGDLLLTLDNTVNAEPGDQVRITIEESALVKASLVLYLVPALGLVGGALGGSVIAGKTGWDADGTALTCSLVGLVFGLFISWFIGKRMAAGKTFTPRLTAVTSRGVAQETPSQP